MRLKFRTYFTMYFILLISMAIHSPEFSKASPRSGAPAGDALQKALPDSSIDRFAILSADMLQSETCFSNAEKLIAFADSLWPFILSAMKAPQALTREDSARTEHVLRESMRYIGGDSRIDATLREISPRAYRLQNDDILFVMLEMIRGATLEFFAARKLNPHNTQTSIEAFLKLYETYQKINQLYPQNSYQNDLLTWIDRAQWLPHETHDVSVLRGHVYFDLKQWTNAFDAYNRAFQMVNHTLYPIGIDSVYAAYMDSIAAKTFIPKERCLMASVRFEEADEMVRLSDSLWIFYGWIADSSKLKSISLYDSLMARGWLDNALNLLPESTRDVKNRVRKIRSQSYQLKRDDVSFVSRELMFSAERKYLSAKQLDPFNYLIRYTLVSSVYEKLGERYPDQNFYQKAADEMEHLLAAKKDLRGYYYSLGDCYMKLHQWEKAYQNFVEAENILRKITLMSDKVENPEQYFDHPEMVPLDTLNLYFYIVSQAKAQTRAYKGKEALSLYRKALTMVPDIDNEDQVKNTISWIDWDDGNIRASEVLDSARTFAGEQNFKDAKSVYLKLLGMLWTQRTSNEINWRIAGIDFDRLGNEGEGIMRMRDVYEALPGDSATFAANSKNKYYMGEYGRMCYEWGLKFFQGGDKLRAYVYFTQAAAVEWYGRPRAHLQLAQLSHFDPRETIRLCELALDERENLEIPGLRKIAELLSDSYRKEAKFKLAREWYKKSRDKNWLEKKKS